MPHDDATTLRARKYLDVIDRYLSGSIDTLTLQAAYLDMWRSDRDVSDKLNGTYNDRFQGVINRGFTCVDDWPDRDDFQSKVEIFRAELQVIARELRDIISSDG